MAIFIQSGQGCGVFVGYPSKPGTADMVGTGSYKIGEKMVYKMTVRQVNMSSSTMQDGLVLISQRGLACLMI